MFYGGKQIEVQSKQDTAVPHETGLNVFIEQIQTHDRARKYSFVFFESIFNEFFLLIYFPFNGTELVFEFTMKVDNRVCTVFFTDEPGRRHDKKEDTTTEVIMYIPGTPMFYNMWLCLPQSVGFNNLWYDHGDISLRCI